DGGVATPRAARENPAHMLLSGPAGGVIAGAHLAKSIGVADLVTFDMGGTSADFSIIAGGVPRIVGGRVIDHEPLRLPTLDIETISAGGGSIARIDVGGALRVGPDSAGAVPGPACYGQGGTEPTVTDAAVVLGILSPEDYLGGELPLDPARARDAVARTIAAPLGLAVEAAAFGVLTVACAGMNQAIRALSVERGHDARAFSLLAFGGAGPMCASFMARDLGMTEVLVPTSPGVFAALGILLTDIRHTAQAPFHRPFAAIAERDLGDRLTALRDELDAALARDGVAPAGRAFRFATDARCVGQFHELTIPVPAPGAPGWWRADRLAAEFHAAHERAYGHTDARVPVEFVNLRLEGLGRIPAPALPEQGEEKPGTPAPAATRPVTLDRARGFAPTPIYPRKSLRPGDRIAGPAIITQRDSTTVVLPGQTARVERHGIVRIAVGRSGGHP
ncbi:MAG: hydantoinase/oxoprolinase family protein, partial [Alphaproteobacteria bacterium]